VTIRDAAQDDFERICALNLADVQHTSAMDLERLTTLHGLARHHKVGCVDGVFAVFPQRAVTIDGETRNYAGRFFVPAIVRRNK
jgi:predicted GNAT superfamily acetyltransferase